MANFKYAEKQNITITQFVFIYVVFRGFKDIKMSRPDNTFVQVHGTIFFLQYWRRIRIKTSEKVQKPAFVKQLIFVLQKEKCPECSGSSKDCG